MSFFGTICCNRKEQIVVDSIDENCESDSVLQTPPYSEDSIQADAKDVTSIVEIARHDMSSQTLQPRCSYTKIHYTSFSYTLANPPDSAVGEEVVDKNWKGTKAPKAIDQLQAFNFTWNHFLETFHECILELNDSFENADFSDLTDAITLGKQMKTESTASITVKELMDAIFKADPGVSEDVVFDLLTKYCNLENEPIKVNFTHSQPWAWKVILKLNLTSF